ncbi:MAG: FMN-binding protein [Clostridia bacterium]|nr:FMN-binding protein [Clostridia bacterium]
MKNLKEILISSAALMLIAAIVTAALAGTNALTKNTIAELTEEIETAARMEVMEADSFVKGTVAVGGHEQVYYTAYVEKTVVGYVFTTEAVGKSAGLTVMTGISHLGTITGVKVTEDNETAGYVQKVTKAGLLDSFVGKPAKEMKVGTDVDAVSQATKTSSGICEAVNKAIAGYEAVKEGEADGK